MPVAPASCLRTWSDRIDPEACRRDQVPGQCGLSASGQAADEHQARPPARGFERTERYQPVGLRSPAGLLAIRSGDLGLHGLHSVHLAPHHGAISNIEVEQSRSVIVS